MPAAGARDGPGPRLSLRPERVVLFREASSVFVGMVVVVDPGMLAPPPVGTLDPAAAAAAVVVLVAKPKLGRDLEAGPKLERSSEPANGKGSKPLAFISKVRREVDRGDFVVVAASSKKAEMKAVAEARFWARSRWSVCGGVAWPLS